MIQEKNRYKVIVGMSGGVDSSVAAYLLQKEGYQVEGLFMKNWEEDDGVDYCSAANDLADVQSVCKRLDIPLHKVNFAAEYWDKVFESFLAEHKAGRTPNPDILCNKEIKFKAFMEFAEEVLDADFIAMGHYVRRSFPKDYSRPKIMRGIDLSKDQSYFLYALSYEQIARSLFPVGGLEKKQVRKMAEEQGFITAKKKDSTGICFIGERKFTKFLSHYLPAQPGNIETPEGYVLGEHQGLIYHTIGQRKGLGIGGQKSGGGNQHPWFVARKDLERNILVVVKGADNPLLKSKGLIATQLSWVDQDVIQYPFRASVKTRYRQTDVPCAVTAVGDHSIKIVFDFPQVAIAPGQSAVLYDGEICLGGGIIERGL